MAYARLTTALRDGAVDLPEAGRIAIFRPRADTDLSALLSALPRARIHAIQGFRPDHDALSAAGVSVGIEPQGDYAAALVCLTRSRTESRALIERAAAVTRGGLVIVDGQKTDGIEGLLKDCRRRAEIGPVVSKAHGKLFSVTGGNFSDWAATRRTIAGGYITTPGLFSADGIDPASAALAAALPARIGGTVADLGAGWGYLSRAVLERTDVATLHLVEAEHAALDCARQNVTDARARFHWADAASFRPDALLDAVVTNPPFHTLRAADPALGRRFIRAAASLLKPGGRMWLVANRHLPYEAEVQTWFSESAEIAGDRAFKVIAAAKPRRRRR